VVKRPTWRHRNEHDPRSTEFGPATARRQYYSPLEAYWDAFREWRKQKRLQTQLCRLTDGELMDIGITRGEIDCVASNQTIGKVTNRSVV
jgi:uncharacterized protein YjiS (DUF1127 family)